MAPISVHPNSAGLPRHLQEGILGCSHSCESGSSTSSFILRQTKNKNLFADATHVVVGTIYGAETYCVFYRIQLYEEDDYPEFQLQEENLSVVVSKMKIAIENNESLADNLQKLDDQDKYELNRLRCRLFSDLQAKPVKECGFFYAYNHCRELINIENDKAVLKSIQLCPLKVIMGPAKVYGGLFEYQDTDADVVTRFSNLCIQVERVIIRTNIDLTFSPNDKGTFKDCLQKITNWVELGRWLSFKLFEIEMGNAMLEWKGITLLEDVQQLDAKLA